MLRTRTTRIVPYLLILVVIGVTCSVTTKAQPVRFVQITDPHLFDGGQEETENKAALSACVSKLNEQINKQGEYAFAVLTGDIGIENLVSTVGGNGNRILEADPKKREAQIDQGASELASILASSKIRVWLFVPGNNDLFMENPDTQYYRLFIQKLRSKLPGLEVIDLCPEEPETNNHELGLYKVGNFGFIGFDNASFKNDNTAERVSPNKTKQLEYVRQVESRVGSNDIRAAYVFYHIPELDDPHIVMNFDTATLLKREGYRGNAYPYSSWFVDKAVHDEWKNQVVNNPKVQGLFAGHYHDWRRDTYSSYQWMQTRDYLSGSLSKLFICPPIAIKRQTDTAAQARGFQEVGIDNMGKVVRTIFWLNLTNRTFESDASPEDSKLALALFYESEHEWSQAETYFIEAAKNSQSTTVRSEALAGLKRVKSPSHPWMRSALEWSDPLLYAPFVLHPLEIGGLALVLWILYMGIREGSRGMTIHRFEGDDELSKQLAVSFPATRAKITKILGPADEPLVKSVIGVYPFVFPSLDDLFPQEPLELVGLKVPNLNVVLKWLRRPKFQVIGGISDLLVKKYVYAEVWRRRWWFGSRLVNLADREIPWGYEGRVEVENFIIDVYLKANASR